MALISAMYVVSIETPNLEVNLRRAGADSVDIVGFGPGPGE